MRGWRTQQHAGRWVDTVRREVLDRMLILGGRHLQSVLSEYAEHYNVHRPHRSLDQASPLRSVPSPSPAATVGVLRQDRLGGLIHEYAPVA
jgi:putative transposase